MANHYIATLPAKVESQLYLRASFAVHKDVVSSAEMA